MPDTPNGDGYTYNFERRMERMEAFLQSFVDAFQKQHEQTMEEIRELIVLQREHRIDIMALFQASKATRERIERLEKSEGGPQA